jgi:cell division protease FtsH
VDEMCSALGGRAAERLTFGKISTGALSDLEKVTKQAYAMVSIYGLNDRIGNISFYDSQGRDSFTKPYSDDTARIIDEEVSKLVEFQYQRALTILSENEDKLKLLAEKLLATEVIFKEDLIEIFGERPWKREEVEEIKLVTADLADETTTILVDADQEIESDEKTEIIESTTDVEKPKEDLESAE